MNYQQSQDILNKIKSSNNIITSVHKGADMDSIGSTLSLGEVLLSFEKNIKIIGSEEIKPELLFFKEAKEIEIVDFAKYDFSKYDLFFAVDASTSDMLTGNVNTRLPNIETIVIDHHRESSIPGLITIFDIGSSSVCEMLYKIFEDWDVNITKRIATFLMSGILTDTGIFQWNINPKTLHIGSELLKQGADHQDIVFNVSRQNNFELLLFWGEMLNRMQIDYKNSFVWTAVPYEIYKNYEIIGSPTGIFTSLIFRTIKGTNFCVAMVEKSKGDLQISIRSRVPDIDVSILARTLNGGGHKGAAGGSVVDLEFEKAVEYVLTKVRNFVNNYEAIA